MPQPALEIKEFDGGITDSYLDCRPNQYQTADNLLVRQDKKFETRFGTRIHDSTMYQIPAGSQRIGSFALFDDTFLIQSARNYYYQNVTWQTLTGPTSNPVFPVAATTNYISKAEYNKHLIVTSDGFGSPQKLYKDNNGALKVRNAGLPKVTLVAAMALANQIKSKFNAHASSGSLHAHADNTNSITSDDAHDLPSLITLIVEIMADYTAHNADANLASAWAYHVAQQSGTKVLTSTTAPQTLSECLTLLLDIKTQFNSHDAGATAHNSGSTQQVSKYTEPQISSAGGTGSNYIYTILARYDYYVGTDLVKDYGPTHQIELSNVGAPNSNTVTIGEIPVIANGSYENWDTSNIKWEIYRTETDGTTHYYLKEVTNGTTSTTDTTSDATLTAGTPQQIYTAGSVLDNDLPPQAKYVVVANDITWYGHVKEGSAVKKSRIRQSKKFDPDSCPEEFYVDLEDEITGMGYVGIYPIAFCKRHIYRIEGFRDTQGRGSIQKREISRTVGAINHLSIVNTLNGCFFSSETGFYWTNGFEVRRISTTFDSRYSGLVSSSTQRARHYGEYDVLGNRVYWAAMSDSGSTDNDTIYVLDLNFGLRQSLEIADAAEATFTNIVPGDDTWTPCALGFDTSGNMVIGDRRGYLFKFDDSKYSDPAINTSVAPSSWYETAITFTYNGPAFSFGTVDAKKMALWCTVVILNSSNLSLQISSKNDDSGFFYPMKEMRFRGNLVWRDIDAPVWLPDPDGYPWNFFPLLIEKRRFPSNSMRFLYKQLQFTNSETNIIRSDDYGTVTVNPSAGTATLNTGSWPSDLFGYFISFASDDYNKEYEITANTSSIVTFSDPSLTSPSSSTAEWVIRGVRKGERLNLSSYSISWDILTASHAPYRGVTGGNE